MRGTAEVLRCWSVTAAGAKGGLELDCDEEMERCSGGTARSGGATSRHGKGQTLDRLWLWSHRWLHSGATWPSSHLSCLPWPSVFSLLCHFLESYRINILTHSIAEERVGRAASTATTTSEACCRSETCLVSPWPTVDTFRRSSAAITCLPTDSAESRAGVIALASRKPDEPALIPILIPRKHLVL